jgi:hypothetical protein
MQIGALTVSFDPASPAAVREMAQVLEVLAPNYAPHFGRALRLAARRGIGIDAALVCLSAAERMKSDPLPARSHLLKEEAEKRRLARASNRPQRLSQRYLRGASARVRFLYAVRHSALYSDAPLYKFRCVRFV